MISASPELPSPPQISLYCKRISVVCASEVYAILVPTTEAAYDPPIQHVSNQTIVPVPPRRAFCSRRIPRGLLSSQQNHGDPNRSTDRPWQNEAKIDLRVGWGAGVEFCIERNT